MSLARLRRKSSVSFAGLGTSVSSVRAMRAFEPPNKQMQLKTILRHVIEVAHTLGMTRCRWRITAVPLPENGLMVPIGQAARAGRRRMRDE